MTPTEPESEGLSDVSDVSLDEEDEELIWKVFFGDREVYDAGEGGYNENIEEEIEHDKLLRRDIEELEAMSDLEDVDPELSARFRELRQNRPDRNYNESQKKHLLSQALTPDQMSRFETYREMKLNRAGVKKICNGVLGHSIPNNIAIVLSAISKQFLGELITKAMEVSDRENKAQLLLDVDSKKRQKKAALKRIAVGEDATEEEEQKLAFQGETPPALQPYHVREAWRLYQLESSAAINPQWRKQGDADGTMFR
ncbi:hypothetical protein DICA3_A05974 [Diutina catenulata]